MQSLATSPNVVERDRARRGGGQAASRRRLLLVEGDRRVPRHAADLFGGDEHVGAAVLHALELADGTAELFAHRRVLGRRRDAPAGATGGVGGEQRGGDAVHPFVRDVERRWSAPSSRGASGPGRVERLDWRWPRSRSETAHPSSAPAHRRHRRWRRTARDAVERPRCRLRDPFGSALDVIGAAGVHHRARPDRRQRSGPARTARAEFLEDDRGLDEAESRRRPGSRDQAELA